MKCWGCGKEITHFKVREQKWTNMGLDEYGKLVRIPPNAEQKRWMGRTNYSFRCPHCWRYYHYSKKQAIKTLSKDENRQYKTKW